MREIKNYYIPSNYLDHTTFAGKISSYDFDGHLMMSDIASKIISDWNFDRQCEKNGESIKRNKN